MRTTYLLVAVAVATLIVWTSGCAPQGTAEAMVEISGPPPGMPVGGHGHDDDHAGHNHSAEHQGPHGGHVIELGRNHEFHAELVEDETARLLAVYILDKDLKEFPIDQSSITMNLIVDGKPRSFVLSAPSARSSRFTASESALYEALHVHEASGKLSLSINGTPYTGIVEHHHHHDEDDGHLHGEDHDH